MNLTARSVLVTGASGGLGIAIAQALAAHGAAAAVVAAIEDDRAETVVADPMARVGAALAALAPGVVGALQRRTPATRIMRAVAAGQRDKR